ncbi:MAG: aminopeptidase N [Paraglaciecola sp.]|jgi:aminopeptidase N
MKKISIILIGLTFSLLMVACSQVEETKETQSSAREVADKLTQEQAISRKERVANIAYTLDIDLVGEADAYRGTVSITFDLVGASKDLSVDFSGGTVSNIELNGAEVTVDYNGYFVTLPANALNNGHNEVSITYQHPYDQDGTGLHRFTDPEDGKTYLYTYLWPYYANRLFPNFDQPNLKASYEMTVRAQADWQVVSSLMEDSIVDDGVDKIWHFPRSKIFSSYIFSLHAGPYKVWSDMAGDIPIRLMARQSLAEYVAVEEWFEFTKRGLVHYNNYFDIAYPFSKYDQLIVPDFNIGAMENVGAVTFAESYVQRGPSNRFQTQHRAGTILHEMAHMWFGDLVTNNWWNGLWLNESFATLMSAIAVSTLPQFSDLWHDFYLSDNLTAIGADNQVSTHPIEVKVPSTDDFFAVFDAITYQKGASVLNQLSHYTGQENFRLGVSNYLKQHAWGNTELKDFIDAQSKQSGIDLTPWATSWLYEAGVNRVKTQFTCEDGKITSFEIQQSASEGLPTLRDQRTQLALFNITDTNMQPYSVTAITISGPVSKITELEGLACPDLTYPNYQGWGYTQVELDEVSMQNALSAIKKSQDPLLRSMLWTSVLNSPDVSPEQIINAIESEKNDRIINQVLSELVNSFNTLERQASDSVWLLVPKLEAQLWRQISSGESSKSTRIIRLENYIKVLRSPAAQVHLLELLENKITLPSLPISQEHRWQLIKRLAILDHKDARTYISSETAADQSDAGKRASIAAESALPDSEVKQRWLSIFLNNDNPLPLSNQRAAMESIFPANQLALQETMLPELINALPMIKDSRDNYYQSSYAKDLFAGVCTERGLALIEMALDRNKIGTTLYRFLSENVQKAQRCVKPLTQNNEPL